MTARPGTKRRRGEPLAALALLMAGWTVARMLLWQSPFPSPFVAVAAAPMAQAAAPSALRPDRQIRRSGGAELSVAPSRLAAFEALSGTSRHNDSEDGDLWSGRTLASAGGTEVPSVTLAPAERGNGYSVQPGIVAPIGANGRWHFAGWVAWRAGSGLPRRADGARPVSYGGTQAGAVVRYDLTEEEHRPALHLRTTYAPDRPSQAEIAAGVGLRPLPQIPVRMMAEVRATQSQGHTEFRPAVVAVTELAPVALPLGVTARGYGQAGWVGGRYSTAFVDGQAQVTREFAAAGSTQLHVGAGAWGGAQKFAERLDLGPTIEAEFQTGAIVARLAVDYRVQVAGRASGGNGVVVTLSTGF